MARGVKAVEDVEVVQEVAAVTDRGTECIVRRCKDARYCEITTNRGGRLPPEFEGVFTSIEKAQYVISAYLS